MKKRISLLLLALLSVLCLAACGVKEIPAEDEEFVVLDNAIYVRKEGDVIGALVESFDKDYYDLDELKEYIKGFVDEYVAENGAESLVLDSLTKEDGYASLYLHYAGYEDYGKFNDVEIFAGTVTEALVLGYEFKDTLLKVENGKLGEAATFDEIMEREDYKVVILDEKVDVMVTGTILFVSEGNINVMAKNMVSIDAEEGSEDELIYIVYKPFYNK